MKSVVTSALLLSLCSAASAGDTCQSQKSCQSARAVRQHQHRAVAVHSPGNHAADPTIVSTAIGAKQFATLIAAVKAAGLVETLSEEGPFTVFAPTDQAFSALPPETITHLLQPEQKQQLWSILMYHVVSGRLPASEVVNNRTLTTVQGQTLSVRVSDGKVAINRANVVKTDIDAGNGLIHVIDSVLLPNTDTIPATAKAAGKFRTLLSALDAAGLAETLNGPGPFTVFAPTDEAIAALPEGTLESLLKPENRTQLLRILAYHVVPGRLLASDVVRLRLTETVEGSDVAIDVSDAGVTVGGARVTATDIEASNGVIHVIDRVMLPQGN